MEEPLDYIDYVEDEYPNRKKNRKKNKDTNNNRNEKKKGCGFVLLMFVLSMLLCSFAGVGFAFFKNKQVDSKFENREDSFSSDEITFSEEITYFNLDDLPENYSAGVPQESQVSVPDSAEATEPQTTPQNTNSVPTSYQCSDIDGVILSVGDRAVIVFDYVNLRSSAGVPDIYDENILGPFSENTQMTVIGGPECADSGGTWWQIKTDSGDIGWMREFTSERRLLDLVSTSSSSNSGSSSTGSSSSGTSSSSSNSSPSLSIPSCPGSLPPQVTRIGMTIRVTTNGRVPKLGIRPDPTLESHKIYTLPSGTQMTVVDGPVCSDNSYFWYVSTPNGYGWVREGNTEFYFIDALR